MCATAMHKALSAAVMHREALPPHETQEPPFDQLPCLAQTPSPLAVCAGIDWCCHGALPEQQQCEEASQGQSQCHMLCTAAPDPDLCGCSADVQRWLA